MHGLLSQDLRQIVLDKRGDLFGGKGRAEQEEDIWKELHVPQPNNLPDEEKREDPHLRQVHQGGDDESRHNPGRIRPVGPQIGQEPPEGLLSNRF